MCELRWYVKSSHYTTWDSRWDREEHHVREEKPILQYRKDASETWQTVPIVKENFYE